MTVFKRFEKIIKYFVCSCLSTVLDVALVWVLYSMLDVDLVIANTIGVVAGFVLSYVLSIERVFDTEFGAEGFAVYLGTFLIGLVVADFLVELSNNYFLDRFGKFVSFVLSKGISVVLPFFFLYFLRKILYNIIRRHK